MKKILILGTLLLCCSLSIRCQNQNKDLKIEVLNSNINSGSDIQRSNLQDLVTFDNYIYDNLPVNKINLKLTNTGNKTYVLFIKKDLDKVENLAPENVSFQVFANDKKVDPEYLGLPVQLTTKGFEMRKFTNETQNDSIKLELNKNYLKEDISLDKIRFQREMNYVVIHPGETKFFSYYKTLPVFLERLSSYYAYPFKKDGIYEFQMTLSNDPKYLKKFISINQMKEIEANGYMLFDGVIASNRIPIKFISHIKK